MSAAQTPGTDALAIDASQARPYLEQLFAGTPGMVELRAIAEGAPPSRSFHRHVDRAIYSAEIALGQCRNVYVGLATRRDQSGGGKDNLHSTRVLWADIDGLTDDGAREAFAARLEGFPLPPSLRVWSGGGEHIYWLLEEPFDLTTPESVARFEHALKGIADVLGADRAAAEAARVLRIPGTYNLPDERKRAQGRTVARVELLAAPGHLYAFEDFADLEARGRALAGNGSAGAEYDASEGADDDIDEIVRRLAEADGEVARMLHETHEALGKPSESEVDAALAVRLLDAGVEPSIVERVIRWRRRGDGKHEAYYRRTVERALAWVRQREAERASEGEPGTTETTESPARFFGEGGLIVPVLGEEIRRLGHVVPGIDGRLYRYSEGVYRADGEAFVRASVRRLLADKFKRRHTDEAMAYVRAFDPAVSDRQPDGIINVRNGLLDWRTDPPTLRPHSASVISTVQLPIDWNPEATCPRIDAFLEAVLPDATKFMVEIIGYAMLPANPLRVAVLLLGPGRNGKTVLLLVVKALLGDANVSVVPLQVLTENRFAAAELFGKLANICGDLDARAIKQTDSFKMLVGGDPMLAERKHRDHFTFQPFALPLFSANEPPLSSDQTEAWFDRWLVVPMQRRIPESEIDPHLAAKLTTQEELEGLLVRAVAGLRRLMARGRFEIPVSVQTARLSYRERLDTVRGFVIEECKLHAEAWTQRSALYRAYRAWAKEGGRLPVSAVTFNEHLRNGFPDQIRETKRNGGIVGWAGIYHGGGGEAS
jgi:putative DNA primase/helicase